MGLGVASVLFLLTAFFAMETGREPVSMIALILGLIMTGLTLASITVKNNALMVVNFVVAAMASCGLIWLAYEVLKAWRPLAG